MSQAPVGGAGLDLGGATVASYLTGFGLSLVLTAIPFAVVMSGSRSTTTAVAAIFCAGSVQILVHLRYFLHVNASSAARPNVLSLLFTLLVMAIFVGGTLWIMASLNYRMM